MKTRVQINKRLKEYQRDKEIAAHFGNTSDFRIYKRLIEELEWMLDK